MSKETRPIIFTEIPVEMDQWLVSDGTPTRLHTKGLGPCLGITVVDKKGKNAGLGHLSHTLYGKGEEDITTMITSMQKNPKSSLSVVLTGIGITDEIDDAEIQEHRTHVIKVLTEKGIKAHRIHTFWNNSKQHSIDIEVDSHTGTIILDTVNDQTGELTSQTLVYPYKA